MNFTALPACMLGAMLLLGACARHDRPAHPAAESAALDLELAAVQPTREPRHHILAATVRPVDHALVSSRAAGVVLRADLALGRSVAAGEILVELESSEIEAAVAAARAALDQLAGDLARETALQARGASAAETVRVLADRHRAAAAALDEARARLAYTRVAAPFAGIITRRLVRAGDLAIPGSPLLEIQGLGGLRAECEVPASLPAPALGTAIDVRLADGTTARATLAELSSASDPATRTRPAKLDLPADASARHGDFVRVAWPAGEGDVLGVPAAALSPLGQMERVFVVTGGRARLRLVKSAGPVSPSAPDRVRIAAGLDAGELVVLAPPAGLRDGQAVK